MGGFCDGAFGRTRRVMRARQLEAKERRSADALLPFPDNYLRSPSTAPTKISLKLTGSPAICTSLEVSGPLKSAEHCMGPSNGSPPAARVSTALRRQPVSEDVSAPQPRLPNSSEVPAQCRCRAGRPCRTLFTSSGRGHRQWNRPNHDRRNRRNVHRNRWRHRRRYHRRRKRALRDSSPLGRAFRA